MKSFKEYNKEKDDKDPDFLSWDSSFSEVRENKKEKEKDKKKLKESEIKDTEWYGRPEPESHSHAHQNIPDRNVTYNGSFHDDPEVKPQKVNKEHSTSINNYATTASSHAEGHASSGNMNAYLRNRAGKRKEGIFHGHPEEKVAESVKKLSGAFTPENTNKKHITTWGGVPSSIGEKLQRGGSGKKHTLAGFTSTSSSRITAKSFGDNYKSDKSKKPTHIIKYNIEPGAGLSSVHHSRYSENEAILHHGAHITYHHTTEHDDGDGGKVLVHHVTVHNTHKPLEKYRPYLHPEEIK